MTGDDTARGTARAQQVEALVAHRLEWYAGPGGQDHVPNPRRPISADGRAPGRTGTAVGWVGYCVALLHLAVLSEAARSTHEGLSGLAGVACVIGLVVAPLVVWRSRRRAGEVALWTELARPWLDVLDGLRLGAVEPGNPAREVALTHVARVQRLLRREARRWDKRVLPPEAVREEVQRAGALTWATSEAWRRGQGERAAGEGVSPLDRLPAAVGPTPYEASAASDASADAATAAIGEDTYDLDLVAYARRRAAMYTRAAGPPCRQPTPAEPLLVGVSALQRRRRRVLTGAAVVMASLGGAWVLGASGHLGWSVLVAVPAVVLWTRARRMSWHDVWPHTVTLAPGPAMAWGDYLDATAYADSGRASVTTVEAIRGCEDRVRAALVELARASPTEEPVLAAELHRLCSEVWTLVGQERAESRLLDGLASRTGRDPG